MYENIFVADAKGKLILDSIGGKSVGIELSKHEDARKNLEKALAKKIWVADIWKSPATGRPVCLVTAPVIEGDTVIGESGALGLLVQVIHDHAHDAVAESGDHPIEANGPKEVEFTAGEGRHDTASPLDALSANFLRSSRSISSTARGTATL